MGCCFHDLFNIAHCILVQFPSSFFSIRLVSVHVLHPYSRIDTTTARKKLHFILSDSDFYMINNQSIAVYAYSNHILMSFSVDEMLLLKYINLSTDFREPPLRMEMSPFWVKHIYSVLSALKQRPISPVTCSRLCRSICSIFLLCIQSNAFGEIYK